jgi:alpha-D-xyloside xylohydrolase
MRAMLIEFPKDPACDTLDRQYMLGDSLLVAPVFTEDGTVDYYLPAGRWTNLLTGQTQQGPGWHREHHNFLSLPLMVRPGTILPLGSVDSRPDYDYADGVTFRVYELADGNRLTCAVSAPRRTDAVRLNVRRIGQHVTASASGDAAAHWQLQLAGIKTITARNGARTTPDPLGIILQPAVGSHKLEFELIS